MIDSLQDLEPLLPVLEKMEAHYRKKMNSDPNVNTWDVRINPCILCTEADLLAVNFKEAPEHGCQFCPWIVIEKKEGNDACMNVLLKYDTQGQLETVTQAFHRVKRWIKLIKKVCK